MGERWRLTKPGPAISTRSQVRRAVGLERDDELGGDVAGRPCRRGLASCSATFVVKSPCPESFGGVERDAVRRLGEAGGVERDAECGNELVTDHDGPRRWVDWHSPPHRRIVVVLVRRAPPSIVALSSLQAGGGPRDRGQSVVVRRRNRSWTESRPTQLCSFGVAHDGDALMESARVGSGIGTVYEALDRLVRPVRARRRGAGGGRSRFRTPGAARGPQAAGERRARVPAVAARPLSRSARSTTRSSTTHAYGRRARPPPRHEDAGRSMSRAKRTSTHHVRELSEAWPKRPGAKHRSGQRARAGQQ